MYQDQNNDPQQMQSSVDPHVYRDLAQVGQQVAEQDQFSQMCIAKRYIAEDHVKRNKTSYVVRAAGRLLCLIALGYGLAGLVRGFK